MGADLHRLRAQGRPLTSRPSPVPPLVTIEAVRAAAAVLRGVVVRTPLVDFGAADPALGPEARVVLKAESLQPIGAFKLRGAYATIASLTPEERARGVVAHSSGNHAQGVARAARLLGVRAVVVMPSDAPAVKRDRVLADGAEVVTVGIESGAREAEATRLAEAHGLVPVPPYDDDRIIAGQGTCGLEIAEDIPDLAAVLVPIGGGGLASGVAVAVRALHPRARLVGVEPELAADARDSLREGRIVRWDGALTARTTSDGTRTAAIGRRPFDHLTRLLDDIVTVTEAEIAYGVRLAAESSRLVVEPSGALTVAALACRAREAGLVGLTGTIVGVVSGGNVDPARYRELLASPPPGA